MTLEVFLLMLMIASTLTGLVTEAIKNICTEHNKNYYANTLAGIVATVVSLLVGVAWVFWTGAAVTAQIIIAVIALVLMSWLCGMVGYDKVMQAISQFKTYGKEE